MHCDWFILLLLLLTPTIWFSRDRKRRSHKRSRNQMETFLFFRLQFRRAYDSACDSYFWFLMSHKRSYDFAYNSDSVASENQPLRLVISTTESNQNVLVSSDSAYDSVAYVPLMILWKPDCRSRKQKRKDKPITMHVPTPCDWFSSSDNTYLVASRRMKREKTWLPADLRAFA